MAEALDCPITFFFSDENEHHTEMNLADNLDPACMRSPSQTKRDSSNGSYGASTGPDQSAFAPENFTTFAHFSVSTAMSFPKSAGEPAITVPLKLASRAFIFGQLGQR
jgi:hypothetical protein